MEKDRVKWNEKWAENPTPGQPARIVEKYSSLATPGRALDVAAGTGGNSLYLAEQGFQVDAVDISDTAVAALKGVHPNVTAIQADLDAYMIPENRYDLVLDIRFLKRRLFPYMKAALKPGGVLIVWTYMEGGPGDGAWCRDFLLRPNELLHTFLSLNVLYYAEHDSPGERSPGRAASLVAVRPC